MGDQSGEVEDLERILTDTRAEPIRISRATIKHITKDFAQVIGAGGFGVVYLGGLRNGMVAVKKLSTTMDLSDEQFLDEVACLMKVDHTNIVRFLGYCADTHGEVREVEGKYRIVEVQQRFLCFEYVPNGNLQHYLKEKTHGYEWNVRYQIIKGICQGLHHIHQKHIYHLDLKPANVLLGANMEPKITDFGVSRRIGEVSTMVTEKFYGTLGYVAPEFIDKRQISLKSDIFSLGVIMINLLTGCHGSITENWHETIEVDCSQMKKCIEIAQSCVSRDPHNRPTMGEILNHLNETETTFQKDHASKTHKPKINEPRKDSGSSLFQVVQRFRALPTLPVREHSRVDTLFIELDVPECLLEGSNHPGKIPYHLLRLITGNFSRGQEIGRGEFAVTYRGILRQRCVDVKRLLITIFFDDRRFQDLIKTLMVAQHKNVVQFLGYCSYTEDEAIERRRKFVMADSRERLLCFEHSSNKRLDCYLSDTSSGLEWRQRYKIIKGICYGIRYLHRMRIVGLDLKAANILLDDDMVPKIADFWLSECVGIVDLDLDPANIQLDDDLVPIIAGLWRSKHTTRRHFASAGPFQSFNPLKSDIYSLGVVIREIIRGDKDYLEIEKVLESWKKRLETSSADTVLLEQVRVCAEISLACTDSNQESRPSVDRIIKMLAKAETDGIVAAKDQD